MTPDEKLRELFPCDCRHDGKFGSTRTWHLVGCPANHWPKARAFAKYLDGLKRAAMASDANEFTATLKRAAQINPEHSCGERCLHGVSSPERDVIDAQAAKIAELEARIRKLVGGDDGK